MSEPVLQLDKVVRTYHQAGTDLHVLRGASLSLMTGEIVALVGPSGCGKSTFLHVAGLLERPDGGEVIIDGEACGALADERRTALRRDAIGFVYQFHHLLPEFSAVENVILPGMIAGASRREASKTSRQLLEAVGLSDRLRHRPARLSGGERQRVAIARALANSPRILIADEPTGNLDPETAEGVFGLLGKMAADRGIAVVVATHNMDLATRMDRVLTLRNGEVESIR